MSYAGAFTVHSISMVRIPFLFRTNFHMYSMLQNVWLTSNNIEQKKDQFNFFFSLWCSYVLFLLQRGIMEVAPAGVFYDLSGPEVIAELNSKCNVFVAMPQ